MKRATFALAAILALPLAAGCSDLIDDSASSSDNFALGDAYPARTRPRSPRRKANFALTETQQDGLGPIFNERSCSACHANGAIGGAGQQIERRYGTLTNGVFNGLASTGGSLRQLFGIGGFNPSPGVNCQSGTDDVNPAPGATIFAGRVTTPTFGLGLVELIPDGTHPGDRGGSAGVDPRHRGRQRRSSSPAARFTRGQHHVARFGWKAVHASLADFAADAYLNEMGITTTSCDAGSGRHRLRDREPRQPRAHQRRHQRLPRRPGPGHRRRLRRGGEQLRRRPHRGRRTTWRTSRSSCATWRRPRAASTTATAAA